MKCQICEQDHTSRRCPPPKPKAKTIIVGMSEGGTYVVPVSTARDLYQK